MDDVEEKENGEEQNKVAIFKAPCNPTISEIEEHEAAGHVVFRSWCCHCVRARSFGNPHYQSPEEPEGSVPTISIDYCLWDRTMRNRYVPVLVAKDRKTGRVWASVVESKGVDDYSVSFLSDVLRDACDRKTIFKSDGENPIKALKAAVRDSVRDIEFIFQETATDDHKHNGSIEVAVREIKRQIRVLNSVLESRLRVQVSEKDPLLAWMPRHAAFLLQRFRVGPDGKTPYERHTGNKWRRPMITYGERVHFRPVKSQGNQTTHKNDLASSFKEGYYVSRHEFEKLGSDGSHEGRPNARHDLVSHC